MGENAFLPEQILMDRAFILPSCHISNAHINGFSCVVAYGPAKKSSHNSSAP
jgi:hypothetical protein